MIKRCKAILFLICLISIVSASDNIEIGKDFKSQSIGKSLWIFEDTFEGYSFNEIISAPKKGLFVESSEDVIYREHEASSIWLHFSVYNKSDVEKHLYVVIDYPLLYEINFYKPSAKGEYSIESSGDGLPFDTRTIKNKVPVFEIVLEPRGTYNYYCNIKSDGDVLNAPVFLYDQNVFNEKSYNQQFSLGFYYGLLLLVVLINFIYLIILKDRAFLFYILYVFCFGLYILIRDGLAFQYLWPNSPYWGNHAVVVFPILAIVFILMFSQKTLKTKENLRIIHKLINYTLVILVLVLVPLFINDTLYGFVMKYANVVVGLAILIFATIAVLSLIKKVRYSIYFLVAILIVIAGSLLLMLKNLGVLIDINREDVLKISSALEIMTLSLALTIRFKHMLTESQDEAIENLSKLNALKEDTNINLEEQVKIRTAELNEKTRDLEYANMEVIIKNEEIEEQRSNISIINNYTTDSIRYARKIQQSILPSESYVKSILPDSFIFFKPKDIVSGDFYWVDQPKTNNTNIDSNVLIAAVDCTGHGVPGALMSIVGYNILQNIINESRLSKPSDILNELNKGIYNALHHDTDSNSVKDGMDLTLISIDTENLHMEFAGAKNSVYIVRNREVIRLRGNSFSIGDDQGDIIKAFDNQSFQLEIGDSIYMFSDGFTDQFSGNRREKFKIKRFVELLVDISDRPVSVQKGILDKTLQKWMHDSDSNKQVEQIDDILVIGIQVFRIAT